MSIFEKATRQKLRFASEKGDLSVEQLWDLKLTATSGFSLDGLARAVNAELKGLAEESFVSTTPDPRKARLELQLEILKHIIAVKLAEAEASKQAADRAEKRRKLTAALAQREEQELADLSTEELRAQIEALG